MCGNNIYQEYIICGIQLGSIVLAVD